MRLFRDGAGSEWEVLVGRESWGVVVAIFVVRKGPEPPRQALLEVASADEGNRLLQELSERDLRALLGTSVPKPTE
jgi:hypothetical protein